MIFQYKHTSFDDSVMVWLKSCRKYKVFFPITQNLSKKKNNISQYYSQNIHFMFKKRAFFCKNNQKSKENCFYIFLYSKYVLSLHRFIRQ